jgi:glycerol dehydrogenase
MTARILGALPRYVQEPGALARLGGVVAELGSRPFILADGATTEAGRQEIEQQLRGVAARVIFGLTGGVCTAAEIERFTEAARTLEADMVAGLGGQTALGLAKGVSLALGLPFVSVPLLPACHLPVSALIDVEADGDQAAGIRTLKHPAEIVLVDSALLAAAPSRQFIAGIGDTLARKFELEQGGAAGALNFAEGRPTLLALGAAESAYQTLREHAGAALALRGRRKGGEALERVIEAMMLLSGVAHEQGGPSIAHALAGGLATLPDCRSVLHGELVAFALLAQLAFEGRPAELAADLIGFYRSIGLPARLAEIGIVGEARPVVETAARRSSASWLVPVDPRRLAEAVLAADALGK